MDDQNTELNLDIFLRKFMDSFSANNMIKATLSKPAAKVSWQNIKLKPVIIKDRPMVQWILQYPTQDITENKEIDQTLNDIKSWLQDRLFSEIYLFNEEIVVQLKVNKKGKYALLENTGHLVKKNNLTGHDREKNYLIAEDAPFLVELGISSQQGKVLSSGRRKFKQINKYIEILSGLIQKLKLVPPQLRIMDMGSGLGYLSFALYDYLSRHSEKTIELTGVELRPELVAKCNSIAKKLNYSGLHFKSGNINELQNADMDILIALHACDTATDMAIAAGIKAKCKLIVLAPCCQKQVRRDWDIPERLKPVLKHGILAERQAEMLTDALRALYLEAYGYKTRVFEFVSWEHTSKNIMITAEKNTGDAEKQKEKAQVEIADIKQLFGLEKHYLEELLQFR